jgi:hypothetical protein
MKELLHQMHDSNGHKNGHAAHATASATSAHADEEEKN